MQLTQYYRNFDLPWEADPVEQRRFRRLLVIGLVTVLVLGLVFPFIHLPKRLSTAAEAVPPRLARLMIEERPKPPPPKPVEQPKPQEKPKPEQRPVELPKPEHRLANLPASQPDIRIELDRGGLQLKLQCAASAGPVYAALLRALADTMAVA